MNLIAIIGTRNPSQYQIDRIHAEINKLDPKVHTVISGCAYGVDAEALQYAQQKGIETIGVLPWPKYNPHVQQWCTKVVTIDNLPGKDVKEAYLSVSVHHPNPKALSQGARKLHARNYGIVRWASKVIACPGNKPGGGGTGQGIRLAKAYDIALEIYPESQQLELMLDV